MIRTLALGKDYGQRHALVDLDLEVRSGELWALVGENGAGKTTALAVLSGQLVPDAGRALIGGKDVYGEPVAARRHLSYVGQDVLLPPYLTLMEMVELAAGIKGLSIDPPELERLVSITGLEDDGDRLLGELSYGMQRKAAWVVALVAKPRALLLDEGLAGLDASSAEALVGEVHRCLDEGTAVLWTEHDIEPLAARLTGVILLHRGRVAERVDGTEVEARALSGELAASMRQWTSL